MKCTNVGSELTCQVRRKAFQFEADLIIPQKRRHDIDLAMKAEILGFRCEHGCDAVEKISFLYEWPENFSRKYDAKIARRNTELKHNRITLRIVRWKLF